MIIHTYNDIIDCVVDHGKAKKLAKDIDSVLRVDFKSSYGPTPEMNLLKGILLEGIWLMVMELKIYLY